LHILMLAPEPFFEPRGTPFSEYHRIKALGELGYHIDLVTYPFGHDVPLGNLRIFRSVKPPFVRRVPIGPSITKVVLDVLLAVTAVRVARRGRYDAVHSHEEAGVLGLWISRWLGVPHLYDMHSSLPQQLENFRYSRSGLLRRLFRRAELLMISGSRVVITICPDLQKTVEGLGYGDRSILIENVMGGDTEEQTAIEPAEVRERWGIGSDVPLFLYTGTLEPYQGVGLLVDAAARLRQVHPKARFLVVGGDDTQSRALRAEAERRGAAMVVTGRRPASEIPSFVAACDVLVSPRVSGTNTPLKIYSYMRSGKPIVATDLPTHTQVLERDTALLVPPKAEALVEAFDRLIRNPEEGRCFATRAAELAARKYSREVFLKKTAEAYARMARGGPSAKEQTAAAAGGAS
jgi:glycosyltransferase involved in cell wall biosynthesis